jgi:mycothiol synthase
MSSQLNPELSIAPVPLAERQRAMEIVFSFMTPEQRREQIAALNNSPPGQQAGDIFLGAYRGGRLVGAGLAQVQPGRALHVWLPRTAIDEPPETALHILQILLDSCRNFQVVLAQILMASPSPSEEELIRRGHFEYLADLLYLVCPEQNYPERRPISPLQFEPYDPADSARFANLVESTYQDTKDSPRLNGVRQIEDVLEGYRAVGTFDPRCWFFVKENGVDIGCLLLAEHAAYKNLELIYMGVIPSARGRGWGVHIAQFAQWQASNAGCARLVLAVDEANQPGLRMYAAAGFQIWDRRRVFVKFFQQPVARE